MYQLETNHSSQYTASNNMRLFIKPASIFLMLVLLTGFEFEPHRHTMIFAQARTLSIVSPGRYARAFETLGMICECCDPHGGECARTWSGSCSNLKCSPWRLH